MVDPEALRRLAISIAEEAAALLRDGLGRVRTDVRTKSTGTDMVTEMDRAAEALIVARLTEARPDDGMLGEEGTDTVGTTGVRWVFDPLDGTTNYLYELPGFSVSIAAELDGTTVAGVVHDVVRDECFSAVAGAGATRDGMPISPSGETELGLSLVATGFSYDPARRTKQAAVLTEVIPQVRDIRRFGAAAVDLCSVACGRVDGYYERGLAPWDLAAGSLIAREAGAVVSGFDGGPPTGEGAFAATPAIAEALLSLVTAAGAGSA